MCYQLCACSCLDTVESTHVIRVPFLIATDISILAVITPRHITLVMYINILGTKSRDSNRIVNQSRRGIHVRKPHTNKMKPKKVTSITIKNNKVLHIQILIIPTNQLPTPTMNLDRLKAYDKNLQPAHQKSHQAHVKSV